MGDSTTCNSGEILVTEDDQATGYSAVFEDDGRVAYAYLLDDEEEIIADVWLYNRCAAPAAPEWRDPSLMPFANPRGFASEEAFAPVENESEVHFRWTRHADGSVAALDVLIRGEVFGRLTARSKPGWARLAIKDGPLAKVWTGENDS